MILAKLLSDFSVGRFLSTSSNGRSALLVQYQGVQIERIGNLMPLTYDCALDKPYETSQLDIFHA